MNNYEIMVIAHHELDEKAAQKFCDEAIVGRIKNMGGKTSFEDFWGARGFAYKIKQATWGYYYVCRFELAPDKVAEMRHELNIEKDIVRFMITSVNKNTLPPRKYAEMKAEYEAQEKAAAGAKAEARAAKEAKKNARRTKLTTVKEEVKKEATPAKEEAPKKDAVDKKLDDIVSESAENL